MASERVAGTSRSPSHAKKVVLVLNVPGSSFPVINNGNHIFKVSVLKLISAKFLGRIPLIYARYLKLGFFNARAWKFIAAGF